MRRLTGVVVLATALGLLLSVAAGAAVHTVTYTQSLSAEDTVLDWYQSLIVPKFDASTGYTLVGVQLDMDTDFTLTAGLENLARTESTMSYTLDVERALSWTDPSNSANTATLISNHITNYQESGIVVQAKDGVTDFAGPAGWQKTYATEHMASQTTVTNVADLAKFIGTGNITLDASATTVSWLPKGSAGSKAAFYYAEMPTTIKVTYQYVPEPAGMIAMGTGLISLLGIGIRRRSRI